MKLIKIISGTYGHRPNGSKSAHPKTSNDCPFEVDDSVAERLVAMKVAAYAEEVAVESPTDEDAFAKLAESLLGYIDGTDDVPAAVASAFELLAQAANDAGVELPVNGVATPDGGADARGLSVAPPEQKSGTEGEENDESPAVDDDDNVEDEDEGIPKYNAETSFADLKQIMKDCGLTYKVGMSRVDVVAALDEYFADEDDGEVPPALGTEEPVI